jgi:NAD-dependent deacetylase
MASTAELARLVTLSRRIVVFSGAGLSTESGIPDFRSPGGVWSRMKPIYFNEFMSSEAKRREAWARAFNGTAGWVGRHPNAGHRAVARLVEAGKVTDVITQNVDNLHQESGVPEDRVIELHGNASYAACLECGRRYTLEELRGPFLEQGTIPVCSLCGGLIKVATISFGQPMPAAPMRRARTATLEADCFMVLGSSLTVQPAASFPELAKQQGAKLIIVNREPTHLDPIADLVVPGELGDVLSHLDLAR